MNLSELDNFKLDDAINFHEVLNPKLWEDEKLRPEVRRALLRIAADFQDFMGIENLAVEDVRISGSNCAYTYTPHSDIDLHLIVDFDKINNDGVYQELFNAKKFQYNEEHNIKVRGYDVELYVQDLNQPHASLGEYSVANDDWTRIPTKRRANLDDVANKMKYDKLRGLALAALQSMDLDRVENVTDIIKRYRKAGLSEKGEFGPENLAFKALRTQGIIDQLWAHRHDLEDRELSLESNDPVAQAEESLLRQQLMADFEREAQAYQVVKVRKDGKMTLYTVRDPAGKLIGTAAKTGKKIMYKPQDGITVSLTGNNTANVINQYLADESTQLDELAPAALLVPAAELVATQGGRQLIKKGLQKGAEYIAKKGGAKQVAKQAAQKVAKTAAVAGGASALMPGGNSSRSSSNQLPDVRFAADDPDVYGELTKSELDAEIARNRNYKDN